ncbi:MAG TPA: iron-only hydrogenase system regulator [Candidatus Pullichristensenella stercorigallinarum]|uniref:Iron-only hydrogenase system regulator n=1 Tax=Candidatus Pullichristensenella stercorigallinarum TaxID=2840909 RepID=A0A9D0ZPP2_9FIRM|nr:iron-only hydrogenase system regulator [Candidatus Pullichristensenella stercorigallinarum]
MQTRVAVMSIILNDSERAGEVNALLHAYNEYVIGRMGIPYRQKGIYIISVAVDAPQDAISALSGKIGRLSGVSIKTAYSGFVSGGENEAPR